MGYPGKSHKQYDTPKRPFEKARIEEEARLVIEYGDQLRENQNFGDNSVEINVQYLKPVTYKVIMDELFRTTIFDGTNKGAIRLYKD